MADPTFNGRPMSCYHAGRGWWIELFSMGKLSTALYVEKIPSLNETAVWVQAEIQQSGCKLADNRVPGLDEHAAARVGEQMVASLLDEAAMRLGGVNG